MDFQKEKITICGLGCALADLLYNNVSFSKPGFRKYLSRKPGDGGISPGKLVFTTDLENFAGIPYPEILGDIIGDRTYDLFNAGGPSLVSMICASQLLGSKNFEVRFYGAAGKDDTCSRLFRIIKNTPLDLGNYISLNNNTTPYTHVLSDPDHNGGMGERSFINHLGIAGDFTAEMIPEDFFNSNITCFGGTALLPNVHANLDDLLLKAKDKNSITVVNTVYDFISEKKDPYKPWPLVRNNKFLDRIDLLMMDSEEALRISGTTDIADAANFFVNNRVSSFFITTGVNKVLFYSSGGLFKKNPVMSMPISEYVVNAVKTGKARGGDTTGCGDNFAGGIIASIAWQLKINSPGNLDIIEALSWGVASGGGICFTLGGVYHEKYPGDKFTAIKQIREKYLEQIS
jgi:sugar/nucleoside kinase (ribokinase family)